MALSMDGLVDKSLSKFTDLTLKPEEFLCAQEALAKQFRSTTKNVYDVSKNAEQRKIKGHDPALPELVVENFDEEQIWQEIELQNENLVSNLVTSISGLVSTKAPVTFCQLKAEREKNRPLEVNKKSVHFVDEKKKKKKKNDSDDTDSELDKIKSRLNDSDDFDDFGDSDDDADFDFGSLGQSFEDDDSDDMDEDSDERDLEKHDIDNKPDTKPTAGKKSMRKKSVVDDKFFKLSDMEAFLEQEDARFEKERKKESQLTQEDDSESDDEEDNDDDDVNYFESIPGDDEEEEKYKNARYSDFFDPPDDDGQTKSKTKGLKADNEDEKDEDSDVDDEDDSESDENESDNEDESNEVKPDLLGDSSSEGEDLADILGGRNKKAETKSSFEKRQEKLKKKISDMEEASLAEKSWQMTGEIASQSRPENSLLEEHLDFENISKLPPVITEKTTESIEAMIKQRIKDKAFNDVKRVIKPWEDPYEFKKRTELSHEKSDKSLSEIYQHSYLKQKNKEVAEIKNPKHRKVKRRMQSLFILLDALSNFHYTPKPAAPEVKIVANLPSIAMEEVAPVSVSDAKLLAPEEVKTKKLNGELKSKKERSSTDKKRDKRKKKADKKKRNKAHDKKMQILTKKHPELKEKLESKAAKKKLIKQSNARVQVLKQHKRNEKATVSSSKKFFTRLQEQTLIDKHKDSIKLPKKRKAGGSGNTKNKNAKKLKL